MASSQESERMWHSDQRAMHDMWFEVVAQRQLLRRRMEVATLTQWLFLDTTVTENKNCDHLIITV